MPDPLQDALEAQDWDELARLLIGPMSESAAEAGIDALSRLPDIPPETFDLVNQDAVQYASEHAADLVTQVVETTRDALRALTVRAVEEGWSPRQFAQAIEQAHAFSATRAGVIAQQELAMAASAGNRSAWRRSGVVTGRRALLSDGHDKDDECDENVAAGVIPIGASYPDGSDGPPFHVGCQCGEVAVLEGE